MVEARLQSLSTSSIVSLNLTECKLKIKLLRIFNNCKDRAGLLSKYGAYASTLVVRYEAVSLYMCIWFGLRVRANGEYDYSPSKLHFAPATISVIASFGVVVVSVP